VTLVVMGVEICDRTGETATHSAAEKIARNLLKETGRQDI